MIIKKPFISLGLIFALLCANSPVSAVESAASKNFVLQDMEGKQHTLAQYKGRWVIVNYWATWCPPCLEEVPDLVALYDSRKDKDVMLLGVVFDYQNVNEVTQYVDDMLMSYPIILGGEDAIRQIGKADVMPTTYIYNPRGELVKTKRGLVTKAYLEKIIAGTALNKH